MLNMKISIIIATYNSGQTLTHTLQSIVAQTYSDYEVIVCDGASTDGTLDVVEQFKPALGGRMLCVSEPDNGLYDAMNKGVLRATGDIVGFLNSDDFYTSDDVLQTIADTMGRSPETDAVYADVHYIDATDRKPVRYYSSRLFAPWTMRLGFMPAHPSFYCRRELYCKYGKFDLRYKIAADFEHLFRLFFLQRIRAQYVHKDFVTMLSGGVSNAQLSSRWLIMKEHRQALKRHHCHTSYFLLSLRYVYKVLEVAYSRLKYT